MTADFIHPPAGHGPVAIYEDGGGLVDEYRDAAWAYNLSKREVRILGSCRSACILALSVKNVCVGPNAVIKAHLAYERDTKVIRPDVTSRMVEALPPRIQARLDGNIERSYSQKATLDYAELVQLGVRSCDETPVIALSDPPLPPRRPVDLAAQRQEIVRVLRVRPIERTVATARSAPYPTAARPVETAGKAIFKAATLPLRVIGVIGRAVFASR